MDHRLSGDLSEFGTIVPRWILKDVEVNHARPEGVLAILHVADLIVDEEGVDKIAADSETFVRCGRVSVGDQELVAARDEFRTLFVTEHLEAVDPGAGFCSRGFVVGVGGVLQGAHRMKIGKGELLHGRRGLRREMLRAQGGEQGTGGP